MHVSPIDFYELPTEKTLAKHFPLYKYATKFRKKIKCTCHQLISTNSLPKKHWQNTSHFTNMLQEIKSIFQGEIASLYQPSTIIKRKDLTSKWDPQINKVIT